MTLADYVEWLLLEILRIPAEVPRQDLRMGSVMEWDSLSHVALVVEVQERFGVELSDDAMIRMTTVDGLQSLLAEIWTGYRL